MDRLVGDLENSVSMRRQDLPQLRDVLLEIDLDVGGAGKGHDLDDDPVLRRQFENARKSPASVFGTQIELPAHHRQHAHDGQPLRRRPLQKFRRRRFLPIGNIVDKAKCGDAAPLEGFTVRPRQNECLRFAGETDSVLWRKPTRRDRPGQTCTTPPATAISAAARTERKDEVSDPPAGLSGRSRACATERCHRTDYRTTATRRGS